MKIHIWFRCVCRENNSSNNNSKTISDMVRTTFAKVLENESLVSLRTFSELDETAAYYAGYVNNENVYASLDIWEERKRVGENGIDIFNFYGTNLQESDVKMYTQQYSGMLFVYSETLDMWVLCTTQCGSPWNGIEVNRYTAEEIEENNTKIEKIKEELE